MSNFLKKLATLGTLVATVAGFAMSPAAQALSYITPDVSNVTVSPNPFDPYTQSATIEYFTSQDANVRVDIKNPSNSVIRTIINEYQNAGWHTVVWDGADYTGNNTWAPEGTYTYEITTWIDAGFTDTERGNIYVDYVSNPNPGNNPQITSISIPNEFEINISQPYIGFHLDGQGQVTITIREKSNNNFVRTIIDQYLYTGDYSYLWDTKYANGSQAGPGEYNIEIQVKNDNNSVTDRETWVIRGKYRDENPGYRPEITDVRISPSTFNPEREDMEIRYNINQTANVAVEILDSRYGRTIRTLEDTSHNAGTSYIYWNGRDDNNRAATEGTYDIRIYVRNNYGSDEETREVRVEYNDIVRPVPPTPIPVPVPKPPYDNSCGFRDVPGGNELCDAIQFAKNNGIFSGYPDGTFRPNQPINRAEVTKVILNGFGIQIMPPTGTKDGFPDVDPFAWYMPFVHTAKSLGIVHGYPNGEFAPQKTMNRAELLKVFLTTSGLPIPACTTSPYADTPNTRETYWYINFVCFSKAFDLMNDTYNGSFSPDMAITRGDVAILFYRFQKRGLLSKSISTPLDR